MTTKPLSDTFYVSTQLTEDDLREAAAAGFRTIINNRPDNEEANQPASAALAVAAQRLGLAYVAIPVSGSDMTEHHIESFRQAIDSGETPVLAFCRSGMRSSSLWAMNEVGNSDVEPLLATAKAAGYDLEPLRERLAAHKRGR